MSALLSISRSFIFYGTTVTTTFGGNALGLTDAQVAERLVISPRTVNTHLTSIYNKPGVDSRTAATRFAVDHGLI